MGAEITTNTIVLVFPVLFFLYCVFCACMIICDCADFTVGLVLFGQNINKCGTELDSIVK
jgi:hypothetical protein